MSGKRAPEPQSPQSLPSPPSYLKVPQPPQLSLSATGSGQYSGLSRLLSAALPESRQSHLPPLSQSPHNSSLPLCSSLSSMLGGTEFPGVCESAPAFRTWRCARLFVGNRVNLLL